MLVKYKGSYLISQSPLEEQGYHFFTHFAFKKFQEEFGRAIQFTVVEKTCNVFFVKHHKYIQCNKHEVIWDGNVAKCSCKKIELVGILCRHILSVFLHKDCFDIPLAYLLSRWSRKEVTLPQEVSENSTSMNNDEVPTEVMNMVQRPPKSKLKGRPKQIMKGGIELAKNAHRCSLCKVLVIILAHAQEKGNLLVRVMVFQDMLRRRKKLCWQIKI